MESVLGVKLNNKSKVYERTNEENNVRIERTVI